MKTTTQTDAFVVADDFLSTEQFDLLWRYFQAESFSRVDFGAQNGKWLIEDGAALRAPTVGYRVAWQAKYPTGSAVDIVMDAIVDHSTQFDSVIGKFGKDWDDFTAFATLYPSGTGLHWHRDSYVNTGSYIFYGHPDWNIEWGGELLLGDASMIKIPQEYGIFMNKPVSLQGRKDEVSLNTHLENEDANRFILENGTGNFVIPKPNRLVVIRGGIPHKVCKVNPAAGAKVRASLGGFFKKKSADARANPVPGS